MTMPTPDRDMDASRELDELIAEQVMTHPHSHWRDPVPAYSSDIAAAWQVVEHSDDPVTVRRLFVKAWDAWLWVAEFGLVSGEGTTAPLAICRAALQAATRPAAESDA